MGHLLHIAYTDNFLPAFFCVEPGMVCLGSIYLYLCPQLGRFWDALTRETLSILAFLSSSHGALGICT